MLTLNGLQKATLAARKRTGNDAISTSVEAGKFQVNEVHYTKTSSKVTPLSGWLSIEETIKFLNRMEPPECPRCGNIYDHRYPCTN